VPTGDARADFTGYEVDLKQLSAAGSRHRRLGHLLGTADLIAQMADAAIWKKSAIASIRNS